MDRLYANKLQNLVMALEPGSIITSKKLKTIGISNSLAHVYQKHHWLSSLGHGAFCRPHDFIHWPGALQALQDQLHLNLHVGGKTALELQGLAQNIPMGYASIDLLKTTKMMIPSWFVRHPWEEHIRIHECMMLPSTRGIQPIGIGQNTVNVSSRERATLELLYLAPRLYAFEDVRLIMESLGSLRGDVLCDLLEHCTSEKVKRLALYFGDKQKHAWRSSLNSVKIGQSLLKIVSKNGKYDGQYHLFLPHSYVIQNESTITF